jgi:hypothetical protein
MSTIILKTAKRTTRVSRLKIRRAVAAVYSGATAGTTSLPVPVKIKKTAAKKTATK